MTTSNPAPSPAPVAPVVRATHVQRSADDAFRIFTDEIGAWWPLPTHGVYGEQSGGLRFRDGELVESALDGSESVWGRVTVWDPPRRLAFTWHPGQSADAATQVSVSFEPDADGTRVVLEHHGWEVFGEAAMDRRRNYVGPNAWGGVLDHFTDGSDPRGVADLDGLRDAYDRFFAAAEQGPFGEDPTGGWNASEVLAHVALNDAAMLAVCQALVHRRTPRFENVVCQDRDVLAGWTAASGSHETMVERSRHAASLVVAALARLDADQLATEVHCRLLHDGEVMVDGPRPWGAVAIEVQSGVHLPAHVEQLEKLRR